MKSYFSLAGLNSLCLTERILKNKPDKTLCETRVLNTFKTREERKNKKAPELRVASPTNTPANVGPLPELDTPLPIALAIIADHLQQKRLRLVDLFCRSDRNKDWLTTRDELKASLKGGYSKLLPPTNPRILELKIHPHSGHTSWKSWKS